MSRRLDHFVAAVSALLGRTDDERTILEEGANLLRSLVVHDDWLPDAFAAPDPERYRQYLLHADPSGRFSVVSFVWGLGQQTPVHDHRVWGLVGVLRGAELSQRYVRTERGLVQLGEPTLLEPGDVDAVSPRVGDIHRVSNALRDETSVSIHLYGADIGRVERATYAADGSERRFVSGYANVPAEIGA